MKHLCSRMLGLPEEDIYHLVGYWMGSFLQDTGHGASFPQLAGGGPVSHIMSKRFPLHQYLLDTFLESVARGGDQERQPDGSDNQGDLQV